MNVIQVSYNYINDKTITNGRGSKCEGVLYLQY